MDGEEIYLEARFMALEAGGHPDDWPLWEFLTDEEQMRWNQLTNDARDKMKGDAND